MGKWKSRAGAFDLDAAVIHFEAVWPGRFREGRISWVYFWFLYRGIPRKLALERVQMMRAVNVGMGGGENAEREWRKDLKEAGLDG